MQDIMKQIDDYMAANGLSKWQFSQKAGGTYHLYDRIASGMVNMRTIQKVQALIAPQEKPAKPKKAKARKK